jgi:hypothetical protein
MPRTKLDRRAASSPADVRARLLRTAAARLGLNRDKDLAQIIGFSAPAICGKLRGSRPWSVEDLCALAVQLRMTDDEIVQFVKGR